MSEDLKARLLSGDDGGETAAKVETWAGVVTVRPLTRSEVMRLNKGRELGKLDVGQFERQMVALAMIDPVMTEDEVRTWQEHDRAGGALEAVTDKISELSGMKKGADKSGVSGAES